MYPYFGIWGKRTDKGKRILNQYYWVQNPALIRIVQELNSFPSVNLQNNLKMFLFQVPQNQSTSKWHIHWRQDKKVTPWKQKSRFALNKKRLYFQLVGWGADHQPSHHKKMEGVLHLSNPPAIITFYMASFVPCHSGWTPRCQHWFLLPLTLVIYVI